MSENRSGRRFCQCFSHYPCAAFASFPFHAFDTQASATEFTRLDDTPVLNGNGLAEPARCMLLLFLRFNCIATTYHRL